MRRRHGVYVGNAGLAISRAKPTKAGMRGECTATPIVTLDPEAKGIYVPLDVFLLRLLDDPTARAPRPACAQAIWQPLFARRLYGNVNEVLKWKLKAALAAERARSAPLAAAAKGETAAAKGETAADDGDDGDNGDDHDDDHDDDDDDNDDAALPHIHEEHQDIGACGAPLGIYWPGDVALTYWGARWRCHHMRSRCY